LSGVFIIWVVLDSFKKFLDNWMVRVDLESLLLSILRSVLLLGVSLSSGNFLHLSRVTSSSGEYHDWIGDQLLTDNNGVTLLFKLVLKVIGKRLVHFFEFLELSLLNIVFWELEVCFSNIN
jgi:hypothetical protein